MWSSTVRRLWKAGEEAGECFHCDSGVGICFGGVSPEVDSLGRVLRFVSGVGFGVEGLFDGVGGADDVSFVFGTGKRAPAEKA